MIKKISLLALTLALGNVVAAQEYQIPKTEWGVPDFQGVWKHATVMPLERPIKLGEKRALPKSRYPNHAFSLALILG